MSVKFIITQDRDQIYPYNPEIPLLITPAFCGFNLYMGGCFLGTFDSGLEGATEARKIIMNEEEFYAVSGYSDYLDTIN